MIKTKKKVIDLLGKGTKTGDQFFFCVLIQALDSTEGGVRQGQEVYITKWS